MGCSLTPTVSATSPPLAIFCISPRQRLPLPPAMPITAASGPPSCADTVAPRCSSSRPSHALSTSEAHRAYRVHHDCQSFGAHFIVASHSADASARCLTPKNRFALRSSTTIRHLLPLSHSSSQAHRARACRPAHRLTWQRNRSIRHSTPPPLISSAHRRGFLPRGLPNPCPSASMRLDSCAHAGRRRTILNDSDCSQRFDF
jgi:hypothetical protein